MKSAQLAKCIPRVETDSISVCHSWTSRTFLRRSRHHSKEGMKPAPTRNRLTPLKGSYDSRNEPLYHHPLFPLCTKEIRGCRAGHLWIRKTQVPTKWHTPNWLAATKSKNMPQAPTTWQNKVQLCRHNTAPDRTSQPEIAATQQSLPHLYFITCKPTI